MKIVRYKSDDQALVGIVIDGIVREAQGDMFGSLAAGPEVGPVEECELLPPVAPSKIIAIGLNYQDHIDEGIVPRTDLPDNPIIFMKPPSALIGHNAEIVLPDGNQTIDAEAEFSVVIGKRCRNVSAADADDVILGYTAGNDVSARNHQQADGQWVRAKGYDTFAPLGPWIETDISSGDDLAIISRVNGETFQSSSTRHLIFGIPTLIEFITSVMTLEPGDVIMTGTPAGPPRLSPGDVCEIEIEKIGVLKNGVAATS